MPQLKSEETNFAYGVSSSFMYRIEKKKENVRNKEIDG